MQLGKIARSLPLQGPLPAITRTLEALSINTVQAGGLFLAGWSAETVMVLYLLENVITIPLTCLRLLLLTSAVMDIPGEKTRLRRELLQGYMLISIPFTFGVMVFMGFFIFLKMNATLDTGALRTGLAWIGTFQLLGFVADWLWLRPFPLSQAEKLIEPSLARIFLLYLAVFIGIFLALFKLSWFLGPFIALKTMVDIGQPVQSLLAWRKKPLAGYTGDADI